MGGIESSFQFLGYKIDRVNLEAKPDVNLLFDNNISLKGQWDFHLAFRPPVHIRNERIYLSGLSIKLRLQDPADETTPLVTLEARISGAFRVKEDLPQDIEDRLVKIQLPALLLPYLRASITSIIASGGYGGIILPLINIHKLAEDASEEFEIKRE